MQFPLSRRVVDLQSDHTSANQRQPSTMTSRSTTAHTFSPTLLLLILFFASAREEDDTTFAVGSTSSSTWSSFVLQLCDTLAPFCGVLCFLAPLPTIRQISRDKSVGFLPLLPYSSMLSNSFVWVMYGLLKDAPSVWGSNVFGVILGAYYFVTFAKHCGPMSNNLPGTVGQHLRGASLVILFNLVLAFWKKDDIIGKEGVFFCIILFASPLAALKQVIVSQSAASIPLPFTVACFINCFLWSIVGVFKMSDFNIYFPNLLGLSCSVVQLSLKAVYGNKTKSDLPK
eukprot:scaffold3855_cov199-Alexandrium_tamarense.AAC.25